MAFAGASWAAGANGAVPRTPPDGGRQGGVFSQLNQNADSTRPRALTATSTKYSTVPREVIENKPAVA